MGGFAGLIPILAMSTFLIFLGYMIVMKKQVDDAQDEHDTTALAKSQVNKPSERNPAKRTQKGDVLEERKNIDFAAPEGNDPHGDNRATVA